MWKKDDTTAVLPREADTTPRPMPTRPAPSTSGQAVIGPSISIRGEVSGDEDLLIQGKVDGSVDLELHTVTVGGEGRVKGNITARVVTVEGEVEGDLQAEEQVILRGAARVQGDLKAPRVVLEDGANFRGLVDMSEPAGAQAKAKTGRNFTTDDVGRPVAGPSSDAKEPSGSSTGPTPGKAKDMPGTTGKVAN